MNKQQDLTVQTVINAPLEKVWEYYTSPSHITKWAFADDSWEAPHAENDLKIGGKFITRMQAKDGSSGFDFTGEYTQVKEHELIAYTMDDGRKAAVHFQPKGNAVVVTVTFEMEHENSRELQEQGWQAILNNFKKHVEGV
ncbi:MAG TPA: SRPBCC family protein [Patescibacteria group bacterium]|nr:SRPBCC family protein [Patescibacteria group bacterium]